MSAADPTAPDLPLYGASPVEAYLRFWRRYALFTGRASRSEYWWVALANTVVVTAVALVAGVLTGIGSAMGDSSLVVLPAALAVIIWLLIVVYGLASIVPGIALSVRRLHDADLSGLFVLIGLFPYLGPLVVLVFHILPSAPAGRRFDAGATGWAPVGPLTPRTEYRPAQAIGTASPLDGGWPAPGRSPATTPVPVTEAATVEPSGVWESAGTTRRVEPPFSAEPSWRRQTYVHVVTADGSGLLATDGLGVSEGAAALGTGAEVWIGTGHEQPGPDSWQLAVVAGVARRLGASGVHLPSDLERYGAISMALPAAGAPAGWRGADGTIGVLLGVDGTAVPESVATPRGEVRLVRVVPLRPDELQRIVVGGREARAAIARALEALPADRLLDPERDAV